MFGSGSTANRCAGAEFSFMYNFNDTLGCGVEYFNYGLNLTAYSEVVTANFVALQVRLARPMSFTDDNHKSSVRRCFRLYFSFQ